VVVVHDFTLSTKFKLQIISILLERLILNYVGEITQDAILQKSIKISMRRKWHLSPRRYSVHGEKNNKFQF
jgi:hypothetical protein